MARHTGTRTPRVEDPRLLTGTGTYVDDVVRPGPLHARFVRSPVTRARIAAVRLPAALKWIEGRQEHLLTAGQARHEHGEARLAPDHDGRIHAATLDHVQDAALAAPLLRALLPRGRRRVAR
ncbi:xanthine dehydrogenase family protein [Streptomyces sp. NPDC005648]|uniref:xanthine dehydrogenase family protein n=1 Tax=Streptomyces sp. NPDC005648 TaxID=3157044 RepID=UPI0033A63C09